MKELDSVDKQIEILRNEIEEIEKLKIPLKVKLVELLRERDKISIQPYVKHLEDGKTLGIRSYWCSPFYKTTKDDIINSWGWESVEEFILSTSVDPKWFSFNEDEMEEPK